MIQRLSPTEQIITALLLTINTKHNIIIQVLNFCSSPLASPNIGLHPKPIRNYSTGTCHHHHQCYCHQFCCCYAFFFFSQTSCLWQDCPYMNTWQVSCITADFLLLAALSLQEHLADSWHICLHDPHPVTVHRS